MRIAYCTNVRLPSERAHGHQIAQVCDALVHLGHSVQIFAPVRRSVILEDYHTYYGAEKAVEISYLKSFDQNAFGIRLGLLGLLISNISLRLAYRSALRSEDQFDLLYTRTPALLSTLINSDIPVILELHQLPRRNKKAFVSHCNNCSLVICLTSAMHDELKECGVKEELLAIEGDAVDLKRFENQLSVSDAREKFGIQTGRPIVGYIGRLKTLGMDKGLKDLLKALASDKKYFGLIVGGPEEDRKEYERMAESLGLTVDDCKFTGSVPAADVPSALAACDILAMPFPDKPHYRKHMSPLKMFEYMAAKRIILTSDLPTIRDVLSEETAVFCEPDSSESINEALNWIIANPEEAKRRTENAYNLVNERFTWEKRMERILSGFSFPQV